MTPLRFVCLLAVVMALPGLVAACGLKRWPKPVASEDAVTWTEAQGQLQEGCLVFTGKLAGDPDNVTSIDLLLEGTPEEDPCEGCPFDPSMREVFPPTRDVLAEDGSVRLTRCGLDADFAWRFRIGAVNRFKALGVEYTDVLP